MREFATEHLAAEQRHLAFFEQWMPRSEHSRLLPLWRLSGYMLGLTAGLLGRRWVFVTIEAVETFVVKHYQAQLELLKEGSAEQRVLAEVLAEFQADEDHHRQDAKGRAEAPPGPVERLWQGVIGSGSQLAVVFARAI